jgi:hypothetical protein
MGRTEPFDAVTVNDRSWREHVMSLHALAAHDSVDLLQVRQAVS